MGRRIAIATAVMTFGMVAATMFGAARMMLHEGIGPIEESEWYGDIGVGA